MQIRILYTTFCFILFYISPFFIYSNDSVENLINYDIQPLFIGDKDAPVKITEYASFTCPHCATFHTEVLPMLKKDYINTGKVLLEYREVYFDGPGLWASLLARCQGNQKYFPMIELIYKKQREWASGNRENIIKGLLSIGRQAGLTDEKSRDCMENNKMAENLIEIFQKNTKQDNISSTPSFIINGELIQNMSYEDLKQIIDKKLNQLMN